MKTVYSIIILLFLDSIATWSQQSCGIYRTANDYKTHLISIPANYQFGKKAIKISDFFGRPYVYITTEQGKIKFNEDSIFAIRNCEGTIYRICKHRAYLLLDTGKLQIYGYSHWATVKLRTSRGACFRDKWITDYYFTVDDTSKIVPLTVSNVRLALITNKKVESDFVQAFPNDKSLEKMQNNRFILNLFISDKTSIQ